MKLKKWIQPGRAKLCKIKFNKNYYIITYFIKILNWFNIQKMKVDLLTHLFVLLISCCFQSCLLNIHFLLFTWFFLNDFFLYELFLKRLHFGVKKQLNSKVNVVYLSVENTYYFFKNKPIKSKLTNYLHFKIDSSRLCLNETEAISSLRTSYILILRVL